MEYNGLYHKFWRSHLHKKVNMSWAFLNLCKILWVSKDLEKKQTNYLSSWLVTRMAKLVITMICSIVAIDSFVLFIYFLNVYCFIFIVYWWGKNKNSTLNLDVIINELPPNLMHSWNYLKNVKENSFHDMITLRFNWFHQHYISH